jgi:hypothetical protein
MSVVQAMLTRHVMLSIYEDVRHSRMGFSLHYKDGETGVAHAVAMVTFWTTRSQTRSCVVPEISQRGGGRIQASAEHHQIRRTTS